MSRIRTIKPEFWSDTKVGKLSLLERLLFISTWNFADDYGVFSASPRRILGESFENDLSISEVDVIEALSNIETQGLIKKFIAMEREWYYIVQWKKHQKVDRPAKNVRNPDPFDRDSRGSREIVERASIHSLETLASDSRGCREDSKDFEKNDDFEAKTGDYRDTREDVARPSRVCIVGNMELGSRILETELPRTHARTCEDSSGSSEKDVVVFKKHLLSFEELVGKYADMKRKKGKINGTVENYTYGLRARFDRDPENVLTSMKSELDKYESEYKKKEELRKKSIESDIARQKEKQDRENLESFYNELSESERELLRERAESEIKELGGNPEWNPLPGMVKQRILNIISSELIGKGDTVNVERK